MPLGQTITALRTAKRLTQAALADKAGIGRVYLNRIENGRQEPRSEVRKRIAKALGVREETLWREA